MNNKTFPPYLGYGKLNPESIQQKDGAWVANYELLGQTVLKVKQSPSRTELIELYDGKIRRHTMHKNLQDAFMHHFLCSKQSENPIMLSLIDQVCRQGNIYFRFPSMDSEKEKIVYYPAAYLFILRLPVTKRNIQQVNDAMHQPFLYQAEGDIYETDMVINWKNGTKETKKITVLEIVRPIAFLYETVQWIVANDLLLKNKLYRAIVSDASAKYNLLGQHFFGNASDHWESYSISFAPSIQKVFNDYNNLK